MRSSRSLARVHKNKKRLPPDLSRAVGRLTPGECFQALVDLQARLLAPGGCPWDREQTHESLRTYLVEETYEVLDALESGDERKLADELGDLLLQVVFHAALAQRAGGFDIREVIAGIHRKLVRRHPHVFGPPAGAGAKSAGEVLKNWEQLKAGERAEANSAAAAAGSRNGNSLLAGVPHTLPAVLEAYQLTRRAARIGFDWADLKGLLEKLNEEVAELQRAMRNSRRRSEKPIRARHSQAAGQRNAQLRREEEVGDLLFVAVNIARFLETDPELALKKANRKFKQRFEWMEKAARRSGRALAEVPRKEMEELWEQAKQKARR
jgi:MazG family protein